MPEENEAIQDRFKEEVLNKKNLTVANELAAEDFVELDPFLGQEQGREGLKQALRMFFAAFPGQHRTITEHIAEGEKVVARFTWRGTHLGESMGTPATGRRGGGEGRGDRSHRRGIGGGQQDPHGRPRPDAAAWRGPRSSAGRGFLMLRSSEAANRDTSPIPQRLCRFSLWGW